MRRGRACGRRAADECAAVRRGPGARLLPAWRRYAGTLFETAGGDLDAYLRRGGHVLILSGGYGAVLADEPIGTYDAPFRTGRWPAGLVETAVAACARRLGLRSVVAFLAKSTDYAKVVRRVRWGAAGVDDAWLVAPTIEGGRGAQVLVPRALGQAAAAFWHGDLSVGWTSSDGLGVEAHRLP